MQNQEFFGELPQAVSKGGKQLRRCCQIVVSFLLSRKDLVQVEATVIEKTESWPKINMKFRKRKNFKKKMSKCDAVHWGSVRSAHCVCHQWSLPRLWVTSSLRVMPALCDVRAPGLLTLPIVTCRPHSSCEPSMAPTLRHWGTAVEYWKQLPQRLGTVRTPCTDWAQLRLRW